ncbi:3-deoxy-manno-octulosonate cytidylyltransferase [Reinekea sp.]|jgi:3-deoxy-manno-octulosonate cytidylyltransferase (CMP-KDO synthetase)|uniref:3-deoxy-manno-octulosonate cytidylyltransferase n=1 Tax=Reinekea sp. TaxID=1970455 RepID=UPI00398A25E8
MKKAVIIPARFSSTRLPGKPLKDILGKPMIVRVCESVQGDHVDIVAVATDDVRIAEVVTAYGFQAIMTRSDHICGTDRLQEAANKLGLEAEDIVINLQGDEPLMPTENLMQVSDLLEHNPSMAVSTLYEEISVEQGLDNPNMVKLVQSYSNEVLYFSRANIPFDRDNQRNPSEKLKRHVGIYAYRKSALDAFVSYPESSLESLEKLEQLRFLENGHKIIAQKALVNIPIGVDTQEDLENVISIFRDLAS